MQDPVIVAAARTAVGRASKGAIAHVRADTLAAEVVRALVDRAGGIGPEDVEDVVLGCAFPEGEQGMNVARQVALLAGLPDTTAGMTVNRFCSSGLEAIHLAALKVASGTVRCAVAGGAESMSQVPMGGARFLPHPTLARDRPEAYLGMGLTAERVADRYRISREEQDAFALESHRRAVAAQDAGAFDAEIVPLEVERFATDPDGRMQAVTSRFDVDEGPRRDTSAAALAKLRPVFREGGTVTAGNSSQTSDGAAAVLVCDRAWAVERGLEPMARLVAYATAGLPPEVMGLGPIHAVPKALDRARVGLGDVDVIELNEAFAAQALAVMRELELDPARVNVNGGAIALGHPLGCTGAKLTVQALHTLRAQEGRRALVTMCVGGGMGAAGLFERLD